jgi:hypothetical protein
MTIGEKDYYYIVIQNPLEDIIKVSLSQTRGSKTEAKLVVTDTIC